MKNITISPAIFEKFPDFKRGIIIAKNVQNHDQHPDIQPLLEEMLDLRNGQDLLGTDPISIWDDWHRAFDSNSNKFPPSIKQLIKRVQKGGRIPFINSVVALFNVISLKYLVPCGGDDTNVIHGDLILDFAKGDESFLGLGEKEVSNPVPGEVIYFDSESKEVMCRRWNWRNSAQTKIGNTTENLVINVDGNAAFSAEQIMAIRDELAELLQKHCGATCTVDLLSSQNPSVVIS